MSWFESIEKSNLLVCKDNLEALQEMPDECIDLIYLDPPFFSGRNYNVVWGDQGEIRSFQDRWAGGSEKTAMEVYIAWMEERVREMHRILKPTGSFYLHCDWHASHYLKVMCDRVFGYGNFRNECIWRYRRWPAKTRNFQNMHDTILRYTKSREDVHIWNQQFEELAESTKKTFGTKKQAADFSSGHRKPGQLDEESPGAPMSDVWDIGIIAPISKERIGYPTQKPLALLERIIKASSNKGDIVLDPFVGGGTTCIAAANLERRYIGIDESIAAISCSQERIQNHFGMFREYHPQVINLPWDYDELLGMDAHYFADFICEEFGGTNNPKKIGDLGIDGWKKGLPVQVKQHRKNVGRIPVDQFRAAIQRAKQREGYIIAFDFGIGAQNEVARLKSEEDILIHLVKVEDIIRMNRRPLVEIKYIEKKDDILEITALAKDPEKDDISVWHWYIDGQLAHTDIVCQRKGKGQENPAISKINFKYRKPVKVRVIATDIMGGKGESRKPIGLDNAYRSPSVARLA